PRMEVHFLGRLLARFQGRLGESAAVLADALAARDGLARRVGKLVFYARMSYSVDTADQGAAALQGRAMGLVGQARAAAAFVEPELLAIGQATLARWLQEEPRLAVYAHSVADPDAEPDANRNSHSHPNADANQHYRTIANYSTDGHADAHRCAERDAYAHSGSDRHARADAHRDNGAADGHYRTVGDHGAGARRGAGRPTGAAAAHSVLNRRGNHTGL
ncbi:MAG TPA: hypothetical protein PKW05_10265, partial [Anaerolineae bacterium]|nr:hypothetical protein [Anaerolineae bacterium]